MLCVVYFLNFSHCDFRFQSLLSGKAFFNLFNESDELDLLQTTESGTLLSEESVQRCPYLPIRGLAVDLLCTLCVHSTSLPYLCSGSGMYILF